MSSYSASRATITPAGRILQQINASSCTFFDLSRPIIGSADLTAGYANTLRGIDSLADLRHWWGQLESDAGALSALEQSDALDLSAFHGLFENASIAPDLHQSIDQVSSALDATVDLLRSDERALTARVLEGALVDLGYTVTFDGDEHVNSIAAYKADHVIAAVVSDGGSTEIDTAGLSGDGCAEPLAAIAAAARAGGLELEIVRRVDHGDSSGGTLIQRGAAANTRGLAAGLIAAANNDRQRAAAKPKIVRRRVQTIGGAA